MGRDSQLPPCRYCGGTARARFADDPHLYGDLVACALCSEPEPPTYANLVTLDNAETAPPFTQDGWADCPDCGGRLRTFNCGCRRCDNRDCLHIYIPESCGALDFGGAAGAPWA